MDILNYDGYETILFSVCTPFRNLAKATSRVGYLEILSIVIQTSANNFYYYLACDLALLAFVKPVAL